MVTKTTLADLAFAETYLAYVARQQNPETRARAKVLLATIDMLDAKHPTWRTELLQELATRGVGYSAEEIFPLPDVDANQLFSELMNSIINRKGTPE